LSISFSITLLFSPLKFSSMNFLISATFSFIALKLGIDVLWL